VKWPSGIPILKDSVQGNTRLTLLRLSNQLHFIEASGYELVCLMLLQCRIAYKEWRKYIYTQFLENNTATESKTNLELIRLFYQ
jgi:hypothetical protein